MLVLMVKHTMLSWMQVWPRSNPSFSRHDSVGALFRHADARLRGDARGRDGPLPEELAAGVAATISNRRDHHNSTPREAS
jgi:hypothetical protein